MAVLAALDIDASTPEAAATALANHHRYPWTQMLPPGTTIREQRTTSVWVHVPHGSPVTVWVELETGGSRHELRQLENWTPPREIDGGWVGEASSEIPGDLPLGYHSLKAASGDLQASMPLIITPAWLGFPERMGQHRAWGLATQLYSVRSEQSWGVGDLTDLEDLAVWSATAHQADFVLANPLQAVEPVPPFQPSPYLPSSRRFANPHYLRLNASRSTPWQARRSERRLTRSGFDCSARSVTPPRSIVIVHGRPSARRSRSSFETGMPGRGGLVCGIRRREGRGLESFATRLALAEKHGASFQDWPTELQGPEASPVAAFAAARAAEIDFHCWLQWLMEEQLADAAGVLARWHGARGDA